MTIVHKGNIQKFTEGGFRDWGYEIAREEFRGLTVTERESWILDNLEKNPGLTVEQNAAMIEPGLEQATEEFKKTVLRGSEGDVGSDWSDAWKRIVEKEIDDQ